MPDQCSKFRSHSIPHLHIMLRITHFLTHVCNLVHVLTLTFLEFVLSSFLTTSIQKSVSLSLS